MLTSQWLEALIATFKLTGGQRGGRERRGNQAVSAAGVLLWAREEVPIPWEPGEPVGLCSVKE